MKSDDHFSGTSNAALAPGGATDTSFTGMNPDTVSTAYDFLMREYSTEGRWPSPDPAGLAAVNPANPQSWNRYAYVYNNPMTFVDPLGLCGNWFTDIISAECDVGPAYGPGGAFGGLGGGGMWNCNKVWGEISMALTCTWQSDPATQGNGPLRLGPGGSPGGGQFPTPHPRPPTIGPPPPPPPPPSPRKVTAACYAAAVINNFMGNNDKTGLTLVLNIGLAVALGVGKKVVAAELPGPGWVYVAVATTYDLGMLVKSYTDCKYPGGLSPPQPGSQP